MFTWSKGPLHFHHQRYQHVNSQLICALKSVKYFLLFLHQWTPLHVAADKGRCEYILGYLVDNGADINIEDNKGVNRLLRVGRIDLDLT